MKKMYTILMALFACMACQHEKDEEQIILPCNLQTEQTGDIKDREIILLKWQSDIDVTANHSTYLIFYDTGASLVDRRHEPMTSFGDICNFPLYAREWEIPMEGLPVIFSGNLYSYNTSCVQSCFYLELTDLKKK